MYFIIANHANDPCVQVSSISDFQFRAFDHVSILAGGSFERHSPDAKNFFKGVVDDYGRALSKLSPDKNKIFIKMNEIIDKVLAYPWNGMGPLAFDRDRVESLRHSMLENTMIALKAYGAIKINSNNNAWFIITYTMRELLTLPVIDSVITYKMIPLTIQNDDQPVSNWVEIDSNTTFTSLHVLQCNEATRTVYGRATFQVGDPFNGAVWYPIMLKVQPTAGNAMRSYNHKLYVNPEGQFLV
jgi:hypothetical protein